MERNWLKWYKGRDVNPRNPKYNIFMLLTLTKILITY